MDKIGHRYVIQYPYLEALNVTNIKAKLDFTVGESVPSLTTIKYWVAEFKRGPLCCQNQHRCGRPKEVTTTEMVKKIYKIVLDDRRLDVRELADMVGISKSAVHSASSNYFLFSNLKKWLDDQRFANNDEVKSTVNGYFEELDDFYYEQGIEAIEHPWKKCIELKGD